MNPIYTHPIPWPDPTPEHLADPRFEAIWATIKTWDIHVPRAYVGHCEATGSHVRAILDALDNAQSVHPQVFTGPQDPSVEHPNSLSVS